jgi:4'-phosphopantetheinyl transferase
MTGIYWLEQTTADLPLTDAWLSRGEAEFLHTLRFPKRRADWKLGRWTAKRAVSLYLKLPPHPQSLAQVEIRPALGGAPEAFLANQPAPVSISISHREGRAVCAVGQAPLLLGCDLEIAEPRSDAFAADYFTEQEQALLAQSSPTARFQQLALLWSAKESVLKALRIGLRLDPRAISVQPEPHPAANHWSPLTATHENQIFQGWSQQTGNLVRTVVSVPAPAPPIIFQM